MGVIKQKNIAALAAAIKETEDGKNGLLKDSANGLKTLCEQYLNTGNKKTRDKMAEEFKARQLELAKFLKENPELVNAEVERALMLAAVGGEYVEQETTLLPNGRKKIKKTSKQIQPNVAAVSKWLDNRDPENWAAKPQETPELEDISQIEEELYGEGNKT